MAIGKDRVLAAAHGAALDVHVVVEDWNASNVDVIAGYSSELHALTNIPVHLNRWQTVRWITRLIGIVLIVQAALLASLLGSPTEQAWGSIRWRVAYLLMLTSTHIFPFKDPDMLFSALPAKATRLKPINFSGRKAALIFIATILGINCKYGVSRWDWMDRFMPNNERRKKWLTEVTSKKNSSEHCVGNPIVWYSGPELCVLDPHRMISWSQAGNSTSYLDNRDRCCRRSLPP